MSNIASYMQRKSLDKKTIFLDFSGLVNIGEGFSPVKAAGSRFNAAGVPDKVLLRHKGGSKNCHQL